jgi:hypothetical protein
MHAGVGRSEETTLLKVVQILRKSWNPKKRSGDVPVIFIDDAHLLGDTQLVLKKAARAELQLLLEISWSGLGYLIMGTSEEAGAEVLLDQGKKAIVILVVFPVFLFWWTLNKHFHCAATNLDIEPLCSSSAPFFSPRPFPLASSEALCSSERCQDIMLMHFAHWIVDAQRTSI